MRRWGIRGLSSYGRPGHNMRVRKNLPWHIQLGIVVGAGLTGISSYWLMANAFNPSIEYKPPVPELDRRNLGLSPADYIGMLERGDKVGILSADLSHLRAKILPAGVEEAKTTILGGLPLKESDNRNTREYTLVYGPELLLRLPSISKEEYMQVSGIQEGSRSLIVFNPTEDDDQLLRATWQHVLDVYIHRAFPGQKNSGLRERIKSHGVALKAKGDAWVSSRDKETEHMSPEKYMTSDGSLANTENLLISQMGLCDAGHGNFPRYLVVDAKVSSLDNFAAININV